MDNPDIKINGTVERIRFRNEDNGYTVMDLLTDDDQICAVGIMPGINAGDNVRLTGSLTFHPIYGEQLSVTFAELSAPVSIPAIKKYLCSENIKGIGPVTVNRIIEAFGEDALNVIENNPDALTSIKGITKEKALELNRQVKNDFGFKELTIYLAGYNVSPRDTVKIWRVLGADAKLCIESNPFILCDEPINLSFQKAREIAGKLNHETDSPLFVRAAVTHTLRHNLDIGHTCIPKDKLAATCGKQYAISQENVIKSIDEMVQDGTLVSMNRNNDDMPFLFLPNAFAAEQYITTRISLLMGFPPPQLDLIDERISRIEAEQGIKYDEKQKTALTTALSKGALILTGGPGTGKTTTLNAMINLLLQNGERVLLAAPTGRAAQRMSDVTGREAKTIHRLLEATLSEDDKMVFRKNEQNLLVCDALIIDEASMLDVFLFETLMRAFPLGCRLILVGDVDQLPSIGPGNVLSDLIASEAVPTVSLEKIFRQSMQSLIVTNAHLINSGKLPVLTQKDNDFFFIPTRSVEELQNTVVSLCASRLEKAYGYNPITDIQVLVPSKIGAAGAASLNAILQNAINPPDPSKPEILIGERTLRVGDKVMQFKNNYHIAWVKTDGSEGEGVFNGEIGVLENINKFNHSASVIYDDKIATYGFEDIPDLGLAYCSTIHKSQGNEYDAVIIPLWDIPYQLRYRNLLYTAVTRAKKTLIIVGKADQIEKMVANAKKSKRYTMLADMLRVLD